MPFSTDALLDVDYFAQVQPCIDVAYAAARDSHASQGARSCLWDGVDRTVPVTSQRGNATRKYSPQRLADSRPQEGKPVRFVTL